MNQEVIDVLHFMNRVQDVATREFPHLSPAHVTFALQGLINQYHSLFIEKVLEAEARANPIPKPPSGKIV